jgi:hypothetical protein
MNKKWIFSSLVVLSALTISAFSPLTFAQASSKVVGKLAVSTVPLEPGIPYRIIEDASSQSTAAQKRTLSGDNFGKDVFERPFTSQDMVYLPDTDILTAAISSDENFYYFTIQLAGLSVMDKKLAGTYGIEFDMNKDGRGDYLVTAMNPGKDWSSSDVKAYSDPNKDVGGLTPIRADPSSKLKSDGYEMVLTSADSAFSRLDPNQEAAIQIAVSKHLIGDATKFLWGAWADSGLRNLQELDYNDRFSASEAGSPIKSDKAYPLKALSELDNTCRVPFGFTTKVSLPGMCLVAQPEKGSSGKTAQTFPGQD